LAALEPVIPEDAIWLSSSSSIAPEALHRQCASLHFFYPVELTGFVEAIFPDGFSAERRQRLLDLLAETHLECIEEGTEAAFAVNRLLLPVQAEAMRLVVEGFDPAMVDEASSSELLPLGQLSLMDVIGLDVDAPAVTNYAGRLGEGEARLYAPLRAGLARCLELGKRGRKNRDGLMVGAPLPWQVRSAAAPSPEALSQRFRALFVNTCHHALERELLGPAQLELALASLFGWTGSLEEALSPLSPRQAVEVLAEAFEETALAYFVPRSALRLLAGDGRRWPDQGLLI
jgi:3-hydroxyacyl-CoA dehydrogenase